MAIKYLGRWKSSDPPTPIGEKPSVAARTHDAAGFLDDQEIEGDEPEARDAHHVHIWLPPGMGSPPPAPTAPRKRSGPAVATSGAKAPRSGGRAPTRNGALPGFAIRRRRLLARRRHQWQRAADSERRYRVARSAYPEPRRRRPRPDRGAGAAEWRCGRRSRVRAKDGESARARPQRRSDQSALAPRAASAADVTLRQAVVMSAAVELATADGGGRRRRASHRGDCPLCTGDLDGRDATERRPRALASTGPPSHPR
jgi:hypothetical protein